LPLQAPNDAHRSHADAVVPDWATHINGNVTLRFLHRNTAKVVDITVSNEEESSLVGWHIRVLGLATGLRIQSGAFINDANVHNPAAFVELLQDKKVMYRGWLYEDFPELFGMDNKSWKVWIKAVTFREIAPQQEVAQ